MENPQPLDIEESPDGVPSHRRGFLYLGDRSMKQPTLLHIPDSMFPFGPYDAKALEQFANVLLSSVGSRRRVEYRRTFPKFGSGSFIEFSFFVVGPRTCKD